MIQPRNDRVLIERIEAGQQGIVLTDPDKSIRGKVLAVGPGKWIPGTWWYCRQENEYIGQTPPGGVEQPFYDWEWIAGYREPMTAKVGDLVLFNSKWNDFAGDHYEDLPLGAEKHLHLLQEADIIAIINA